MPIIPAANYSGRGTLHLSAGLEENVVEVSGRDGLPAGTLYLENQKLYQLVRTGRDYEGFINETYYEKYRDIVDNYFDSRLEEVKDAGYVSWELSEFLGVLGTTKQDGKGVVAFQMKAAFSTDPPELAPDRIARRRLRGQPAPGPRAGLAERLSGDPGRRADGDRLWGGHHRLH